MTETINVQIDAKQLVLEWMGANAYIPCNKKLLRQIGDTNTILLSESINQYRRWSQQGKLQQNGSFYWTQIDCEIETGYSRSTQQRAFKDMEKRELLKTFNKKVVINEVEKSVRFIKLNFAKIGQLMFSNDKEIIESIKKKYEDRNEQNQESRKRVKEQNQEKARTQNEPSQSYQERTQNESSERGLKMNPREDSKWGPSNKDLELRTNISSCSSDNHKNSIDQKLKEKYPDAPFEEIKAELLNDESAVINTDKQYHSLLEYRLENWKPKPSRKGKVNVTKKPVRTELLPDWFDNENGNKKNQHQQQDQDQEQKKQEIEDMLKKLRS